MSWNVSTRLNNIQQQLNNIANTGLTNPLEQILNANSYAMQNLSVLDGGANALQLKSSNVALFQLSGLYSSFQVVRPTTLKPLAW